MRAYRQTDRQITILRTPSRGEATTKSLHNKITRTDEFLCELLKVFISYRDTFYGEVV